MISGMRLPSLLATSLLLGSLWGTHAQVVYPGPSSGGWSQNSGSDELESALQTAVGADRLDRNNAAFYITLLNILSPRCAVPTGGTGACGRLFQCPYLFPYVKRINKPSYFNFVKSHICSIQGGTPYVCCPFQVLQLLPQPLPQLPQQPQRPQTPQIPQIPSSPHQPNRPQSPTSQIPFSNSNICGLSYGIRISGGQPIEPGTWPWLAAVGFPVQGGQRFTLACGGSLITTRHVLTAAHCFSTQEPTHVRLGEHDRQTINDGAQHIDFRIVNRVNPGYNGKTFLNDIELLTLDGEVTFSDFIRPACLPTKSLSNNFKNAQFTVVGWGRTTENGTTSNVPLAARVASINIRQCMKEYAPNTIVDSVTMMCAASPYATPCRGDSGGPLHYLSVDAGRYYVVGVVSFIKKGCDRIVNLGVYTRVDAFLPWISQAIRNS